MGRPKKWTDEERLILNKCKHKNIQGVVKEMFGLDIEDINQWKKVLERQAKYLNHYSYEWKVVVTLIKQSNRLLAIKIDDASEEEQPTIIRTRLIEMEDRIYEITVLCVEELYEGELAELQQEHKRLKKLQFSLEEDFLFEDEKIVDEPEDYNEGYDNYSDKETYSDNNVYDTGDFEDDVWEDSTEGE